MKMKLLVVDDSPAVRQLIRRCLADLAFEISEIEDGADAVAAYRALLPDWVLMDIRMKKVGGIAATASLKAAYPEARIVIVTNCNDDRLRETARDAGACGYVLKENLLDLRGILAGQTPARFFAI